MLLRLSLDSATRFLDSSSGHANESESKTKRAQVARKSLHHLVLSHACFLGCLDDDSHTVLGVGWRACMDSWACQAYQPSRRSMMPGLEGRRAHLLQSIRSSVDNACLNKICRTLGAVVHGTAGSLQNQRGTRCFLRFADRNVSKFLRHRIHDQPHAGIAEINLTPSLNHTVSATP